MNNALATSTLMAQHHTTYPVHPTHLQNSKWTSTDDALAYCHWEVLEYRKSTGQVLLRATLNKQHHHLMDWKTLRDRARWQPGWV